jgi:CubicO group peptidase (beta-lactamase class C family)
LKWAGALWLSGLATIAASAGVSAQKISQTARVDSVFATYDNTRSPGCAVGVFRNGNFVLKRGYGMANLEHGVPLTAKSVFRIGSTSKQFTAAAIVLLAQEHKLSLDDDIRLYLPRMPSYPQSITIRHLLHHTSGVRDYLGLMWLAGRRDDDFYTDEDVVTMLARQRELNFPPGDQFLYSNSGYFLLSQIVKSVSGKTLREYADENIFEPLAMIHTHFHDDHTQIVPNRATGYAPADNGGFQISMTTLGMIGDGGVFTSIEDLRSWDRLFYDTTAVAPPFQRSQEFWSTMLTPGVLNDGDTLDYALGLRHGNYRGVRTISHGGAFVGFRAEMLWFPDERMTIVCLCNLSATNPSQLAQRVADIYLEDRLAPLADSGGMVNDRARDAAPIHIEMSDPEGYTGTYYSEELDVAYVVRLSGDSLLLEVGNDLDGVLLQDAEDVLHRNGIRLRMQRDQRSRVAGFLLDAGRVKNLRFVRQ